jgi:signal transduction histidine kinase
MHADGTMHDVVFNRAALRSQGGLPEGLIGVILDITDSRRAERQRQKLEAQMHHSRMLESLMVQLSHDLMTPLTPLSALFPLMRKKANDPQLERMLEICQQSAGQIERITSKSLELVRLSCQANRSELVPALLAQAAESALRGVAPSLAARGVDCTNGIDPSLRVMGAADQLALLFGHLLGNAARYAAPNGTVRIEAGVGEAEVRISVQDDGIGLEPEHTTQIFYEFFKADSARHDPNTQGLGLAICQRIVVNHGGRIWAQSPGIGQGTTIFFTLKGAAKDRNAHA